MKKYRIFTNRINAHFIQGSVFKIDAIAATEYIGISCALQVSVYLHASIRANGQAGLFKYRGGFDTAQELVVEYVGARLREKTSTPNKFYYPVSGSGNFSSVKSALMIDRMVKTKTRHTQFMAISPISIGAG
jgi:hypothetical protein